TVTAGTSRPITNDPDLLAFLGPIDTPSEAILVALLHGQLEAKPRYGYSCQDRPLGARQVEDGWEILSTRLYGCVTERYRVHVGRDGSLALLDPPTSFGCTEGRRPPGLVAARRRGRSTIGEYFAEAARLEAASVIAFRGLAKELAAHGAPRGIVR